MKRRTWTITILALSALGVLLTVFCMQWKPMVLYFRLGEARKLVGEWRIVELFDHGVPLFDMPDEIDGPIVGPSDSPKSDSVLFSLRWEGIASPRLYSRSPGTDANKTSKRVRVENTVLIWGDARKHFCLDGDLLTLQPLDRENLMLVLKRVQAPMEPR